jgi:hypothetical protein
MDTLAPSISLLLDRISEHYRANIANRFLRPALLQLPLDSQSWDLIEELAKGSNQSIHLDELYRKILAAAQFIDAARREQTSGIRKRLATANISGSEKVLCDMAVNNLTSNLRVFADLVNELFIKLVETDKSTVKNRPPVYTTIPGVDNIGRLLIG